LCKPILGQDILTHHIKALQALRIDNINQTLDAKGKNNKLEMANNELFKEITKLERLVTELKQKKKTTT